MSRWLLLAALLALGPRPVVADRKLRIGVTNHAYYSWVANVARGAPVVIEPIVPAGRSLHAFQPRPSDIKRVAGLDVLVANGLGHDAFVDKLLRAAGNQKVKRIALHEGVPLLRYQRPAAGGHGHGEGRAAYNPHTFISLSTAIQQIYNLEKGLAALMPAQAGLLRRNTRAYARVLRKLKARTARALLGARTLSVATVHDGYAYLLGEFGLRVTAVIEPKHGIEPSAAELARTIAAIKKAGVRVVFSELDFPERYLKLIRDQAGVRVHHLRHISGGEYTADRFVTDIEANLKVLAEALSKR